MSRLKEFKEADPRFFYTEDRGFQKLLSFLMEGARKDRLHQTLQKWEKNIPSWNELADEAARPEKGPRVQKYDRVGNRIEKIVLPLETRTIRRQVVEEGLFLSDSEVEKFAKIYLLSQIGESGVTCPLACTDGLIRVLKAKGSSFLKEKYLPLLLSSAYPLSGAQFITEQAGGSDVGAIEGRAYRNGDGSWRIFSEKWYCSAADEFFILMARPEGAPLGTEGLALFFVPRLIDGEPNQLSIRRLKDKLGTQSLPTAEIDFEGSKAYLIGDEKEGFYYLMNYVINVSRIHNAANGLGFLRRAFYEARNYAEQRIAFGKEIIHYPLIQESLLKMLAFLTSRRSLYFSLVAALDKKGLIPEEREERLWLRFLINLLKYRTSVSLTGLVKEAILIFGANGTIQDFSILPRLLKDSVIIETWEGTHNTLCLQILKDSLRFDFLGRLKEELQSILEKWPEEIEPSSRAVYEKEIKKALKALTSQRLNQPAWVQTHARRVVDRIADLLEIGSLACQGIAAHDASALTLASYLITHSFGDPLSLIDDPSLALKDKIILALIREEEIS